MLDTLAVLERLGLASSPRPDLEGLRALYRAWSFAVPFDNLRKMIALRTGVALPGREAADFFEGWLNDGAGGTCWSGSNALFELVRTLGFDARRTGGSMYDMGPVNHGSTVVSLDGVDWLVDSSLLTREPIPLSGGFHLRPDGATDIELEPDAGTYLLWTAPPHQTASFPCRIHSEPMTQREVLAKYEESRWQGPFNQRLYARKDRPGRAILLRGRTRYERAAGAIVSRDLTEVELCESLRTELGFSESIIEAWVRCGGLTDSFGPPAGPNPPAVTRVPPSQRSLAESHSVISRL